MGEFEEQVRRYWPTGDPLNQASQFLRSEQINVALRLCRMYLVDKVVMDDEQQKREAAYHRAMQEQRQVEQQLAHAREEIERLQARDAEWAESQAKAVTRYAQARALLEEWLTDMGVVADTSGEKLPGYEQALIPRTRAFLGWKESSDGK